MSKWLEEDVRYEQNELLVVESFEVIWKTDGRILILIKGKGFDIEEADWVFFQFSKEDVRENLKEYLEGTGMHGTPRELAIVRTIWILKYQSQYPWGTVGSFPYLKWSNNGLQRNLMPFGAIFRILKHMIACWEDWYMEPGGFYRNGNLPEPTVLGINSKPVEWCAKP